MPATLASRIRVLATGGSNKNDPNDALSVAIAAFRAPNLRSVEAADHSEVLRLLAKRNGDLGSHRTRVVCRLHALLAELAPGGIAKELYVSDVERLLAKITPETPAEQVRYALALIEGAPPMSVHKRVNKRRGTVWVVRYRDPLPRERTFDRKADAERFERYVRHQLDTDQCLDGESARLTFADWAERWWPTVENSERAPSTISGYESALRIQVLPYLGERRLRTLHRIDMEEWLGELRAAGYSNSTIHAARTVASMILASALDAASSPRTRSSASACPRPPVGPATP